MSDLIAWLAKEAAYRSYLTPPKRVTSHSRTYKLRSENDDKEKKKAMDTPAGNAQLPFRYGRKLKQ